MKKGPDNEEPPVLRLTIDEERLGQALSGKPFEVIIGDTRRRVDFIELLKVIETPGAKARIIEKEVAEEMLAAFGLSPEDLKKLNI